MQTVEWTSAKALELIQAPERFLADDRCREWVLARGGLSAVYAMLQQFPLKDKHRAVLTIYLTRPGMSIDFYADALAVHFTTFHNHRRELVAALVQFLNALEDAPAHTRPEDIPAVAIQDGGLASASSNLPQPISSFIGRKQDLKTLRTVTRETRLLSLVGIGGVGKTRLVLELGRWIAADEGTATWFIDMSVLNDAEPIPTTLAATIGIGERSDQSLLTTISTHLREVACVLILDNCEHILEGCTRVVAFLLTQCPRLRILTTSREPLGIIGEYVFVVEPLGVPPRDWDLSQELISTYEAAELFLDRARAIQPQLAVAESQSIVLAKLCHDLDGLPLALELAAVQLRYFSIEQIADRLHQRFTLLAKGDRAATLRHQTLQAVMDWSYELLSADEQQFLNALSVFSGGWSLAAVEVVCNQGDDPESLPITKLRALIDKSLVVVHVDQHGVRYRLLETVRHYALEKLVQSSRHDYFRQAHFLYFVDLAERLQPKIQSRAQQQAFQPLSIEHENFQSALDWVLEHEQYDLLGRLAGALGWFWNITNQLTEGIHWLSLALQHPAQISTSVYKAILHEISLVLLKQNQHQQSHAYLSEYLELCRSQNDLEGAAEALTELATMYATAGDLHESSRRFGEVCQLWRELNNSWALAIAISNQAYCEIHLGLYAEAEISLKEALFLIETLNDGIVFASTLTNFGWLRHAQGRLSEARSYFREAIKPHWTIRDRYAIAEVLEGLASTDPASPWAVQLLGAAEMLLETIGAEIASLDQPRHQQIVRLVQQQTSPESFAELWSQGRQMTLEEIFACVDSLPD